MSCVDQRGSAPQLASSRPGPWEFWRASLSHLPSLAPVTAEFSRKESKPLAVTPQAAAQRRRRAAERVPGSARRHWRVHPEQRAIMGACFSSPAEGDGQIAASCVVKPQQSWSGVDAKALISERAAAPSPSPALIVSSSAASLNACGSAARLAAAECGSAHSDPRRGDAPLETLLQVQGLQNSLAAVSDVPGLGLSEAAELLQEELAVSLVR